ncbi:hypothetical protein [Cupriavidus sp. AU9028]|uniref:hypothetical protein n=1 Tax=Cupriavidus sp. AU9028 TaxID=2871157 RepID=UPI001C9570B8|nr:hypothetical protein [Cupriavidus sp. AU9028]MBY4899342.1 hypothetical protein [Cupriavidus sp. AU9028]
MFDPLWLLLKRVVGFLFRRTQNDRPCPTSSAKTAGDGISTPTIALASAAPAAPSAPLAPCALLVRGQLAPDGDPYSTQAVAASLSLADLAALSRVSRAMQEVARLAFVDLARNPSKCTGREIARLFVNASTRQLILQNPDALARIDYVFLLLARHTARLVFDAPSLLAVAAARERLTERSPRLGEHVFSHWAPFYGSHPSGYVHAVTALVGNREFMLTVCRSPNFRKLHQGMLVFHAQHAIFRLALAKVLPELTSGADGLPRDHAAVMFLTHIAQSSGGAMVGALA